MINPQEYVNKAYQLAEKVYGNRLIFAAHYGSFNYGLADEESDCDVALIVMPSMEEIVRCESSNAPFKYSPEGNIDVIDIGCFNYYYPGLICNSIEKCISKFDSDEPNQNIYQKIENLVSYI